MPTPVILLHGLWMPGVTMGVLQHRLAQAGYPVENFDYRSVAAPLADTLARLRERMRVHPAGVHVVGHSLGGLLALMACQDAGDLPAGRIVCLASPLTGSAVARQLEGRGGAWLLGHSRSALALGLARWDGPREAGMVAGTLGVGVGAVVGRLKGENDGTVAVAETRLPGLADHCVVATSHAGMLVSRAVARQVVAFLRDGRFRHAASPDGTP